MRVLLDSCMPARLAADLAEHEVQTTHAMGWSDFDDGPLLEAMADRFDALVTVDSKLRYQQRLDARPFAVVVLRSKSNRLADLRPLVPKLRASLESLKIGTVVEISS